MVPSPVHRAIGTPAERTWESAQVLLWSLAAQNVCPLDGLKRPNPLNSIGVHTAVD